MNQSRGTHREKLARRIGMTFVMTLIVWTVVSVTWSVVATLLAKEDAANQAITTESP